MSVDFALPTRAGAYRWLYLDVADGEHTLVCIFMLGSIFSPRYVAGGGPPVAHSAVNLALYRGARRLRWVLTEYPRARLDGDALEIGNSRWRWTRDGALHVSVRERAAPWGGEVAADVQLEPLGPPGPVQRLSASERHLWEPRALHARARVAVPSEALAFEGRAYHDGNRGDVPLGHALRGWQWSRIHDGERTRVIYRPDGAPAFQATASAREVALQPWASASPPEVASGWGLPLPTALGPWPDVALPPPALLESSPFYARLQARVGDREALGEVADFARFRRPTVRWMARFRERVATR